MRVYDRLARRTGAIYFPLFDLAHSRHISISKDSQQSLRSLSAASFEYNDSVKFVVWCAAACGSISLDPFLPSEEVTGQFQMQNCKHFMPQMPII